MSGLFAPGMAGSLFGMGAGLAGGGDPSNALMQFAQAAAQQRQQKQMSNVLWGQQTGDFNPVNVTPRVQQVGQNNAANAAQAAMPAQQYQGGLFSQQANANPQLMGLLGGGGANPMMLQGLLAHLFGGGNGGTR